MKPPSPTSDSSITGGIRPSRISTEPSSCVITTAVDSDGSPPVVQPASSKRVRSTNFTFAWVCRRSSIFRSEEHTSELQSLMRISYAVFCLKKKKKQNTKHYHTYTERVTNTNTDLRYNQHRN